MHADPSSMPQSAQWSRIGLTYLSVIVVNLNIHAIPPTILTLMKELDISYFTAGLFMTVHSIVFCISNLFAGMLSDRIGPRRIILCGLVVTFIAGMVFSYSSNIYLLVGTRVLTGCAAAATIAPAIMYLLRWISVRNQPVAISGHSASLTAGSAIAFLITPILISGYPWRSLFRVYALMSIALAICLIALRKDSNWPSTKRISVFRSESEVTGFINPTILLISMIMFIIMFQIVGSMTWLAPWLQERCGLSPLGVGIGSMAYSLVGIPSALAGGYLGRKFFSSDIRRLMGFSQMAMAVSTITVLFVFLEGNSYLSILIVVIMLARGGSFLCVPPLLTLAQRAVKPQLAGSAIGFVTTIAQLGGFLGSLMGGIIINETGEYRLLWIIFAATILIAVAIYVPLKRSVSRP